MNAPDHGLVRDADLRHEAIAENHSQVIGFDKFIQSTQNLMKDGMV